MNKNGTKDFGGWIKIKAKIDHKETLRTMKEGEIWWCNVGENVGTEICGKGKDFLRPVLIVKKLNKHSFFGVPLTSKKHIGDWYVEFGFKGGLEYAVVAQMKNISVYRLCYKMGQIPRPDLNKVLDGIQKLFAKMSPNLATRTGG